MPSGDSVDVTRKICAIFQAKKMPDSSTPTRTPIARLWVATTTATVASMTLLELRGWLRRVRIDDRLKVPIDTMIMIATRAAIGMRLTRTPRTTTRKDRKSGVQGKSVQVCGERGGRTSTKKKMKYKQK